MTANHPAQAAHRFPAGGDSQPATVNERSGRHRGFSLIELLVAMAVLALFALILSTVTDSTFDLWRRTQNDISAFEKARAAYDIMTRRLSQATLNTYLDYYDDTWQRRQTNNPGFVPARYGRASDLHFLSGDAAGLLGGNQQGHGVFFFAPLGFTDNDASLADLPNLLNAVGYFVEWGNDSALRPGFLSPLQTKNRFRLMETVLPAQNFTGYPQLTNTDPNDDDSWITDPTNGILGTSAKRHPLAENIIALIIRPELTERDAALLGADYGRPGMKPEELTADYFYDSRAGEKRTTFPDEVQFAQLPPLLRVIMVAVSDQDVTRLASGSTIPPALKLNPNWFTDPSKLNEDLESLGKQLSDNKVSYRIFNQVIPLRGAKFSAEGEQ